MKTILEGSRAVALAVKLCQPAVVSAYPITPQTHIVEDLAQFKADGLFEVEYVRAESEFAAASIVLGASSRGVRVYSATCSQGLLLMAEVLFNIAGMRLPVVLTCANRAVSAPINIWCFSKEAEVLMADLTYKPINQVKIGDLVLGKDRKGNLQYSRVTKTFQRYTDALVELKTAKFNLTCTSDHKFYQRQGHLHWSKAKNLVNKKLHWFGYGFQINDNFKKGWLAGIVDGDGSFYTQGKRFNFRLKVKDVEMVDTFIKWANYFGYSLRKVNYLEREGYFIAAITLTNQTKAFKKFLEKTDEIDFCRGYIAGMYDAEGTGPFKVKQAVIYNDNYDIVKTVTRYLKLLDLKFKVYVDKRSDNYHIKINNVPEFFVRCRPIIARKRENVLRMTLKSIKSRLEILKVTPVNKKIKVYNLETETNNYIVNGFLVHNCDQQDALTVRDAGWLMLFVETSQEAVDTHIQAFKIAEEVRLPVMVNMDGFILTHTFEPVEIPSQVLVNKYLPSFKPEPGQFLDPQNPRTLGAFATPAHYMEIREDLANDLMAAGGVMKKANQDFKKIFGRSYGDGLVEYFGPPKAPVVLVALGSVVGSLKEAVAKRDIGILKIRCFRPFPKEEVVKALSWAKYIGVIDKAISLGEEGILASEVKGASFGRLKGKIQSFVVGLGGRDVTPGVVEKIIKKVRGEGGNEMVFVGK